MNELECIKAFIKVVEVGSFSEAARQTGTVKSVITKRVNQLEEHLELQLLQRSTRRLTITDGGADFYQRTVHILSELAQAKEAVSSTEWGLSGNFRVSCISSFTSTYLSKDLCEFQQMHPDLKIELQQHDRQCDPVQEGFDICLQPSAQTGVQLEKVDIFSIKRLLVASPTYIKKYGAPEDIKSLNTHRFAHNNHLVPDCIIQLTHKGRKQAVTLNPDILTNTAWMLKASVMQGDHIALMPAFFIEKELLLGELIPILPQYIIEGTELSAYYRRSPFVPMKVRIFINFLKQKYGDFPIWDERIVKKFPELSKIIIKTSGVNSPKG